MTSGDFNRSTKVVPTLLLLLLVVHSGYGLDCNITMKDLDPAWDEAPYSCRDRCGEVYTGEPCACDSYCTIYGNCCEDLTEFCPLELQGQEVSVTESTEPVTRRYKPLPQHVQCRARTRLISICPEEPQVLVEGSVMFQGHRIVMEEIAERCNTGWEEAADYVVLQAMPVADAASGHHFANVFCMLCHGGQLQHVRPWDLNFIWNFKRTRKHNPRNLLEVLDLARDVGVELVAVPPRGVTPRRCLQFDTVPCPCSNLVGACATAPDSYVYGNKKLYRNTYCLLCDAAGDRSLDVQKPNMEIDVFMRSSFEFSMLMSWSSPKSSGQKGSVQLVGLDLLSFTWTSMDCTINTDDEQHTASGGSRDRELEQGVEDQEQGRAVVQDAGEKTDAAAPDEVADVGEEVASDSHEEELDDTPMEVDGGDTAGEAGSVRENGFGGSDVEKLSNTTTTQVSFTDRHNTDPENQDNATDTVPGPTLSTSANYQCKQAACVSGRVKINGVCRNDVSEEILNLLIACPDITWSTITQREVNTAATPLTGLLEQRLQESLHEADIAYNVMATEIILSQDQCLWNITAKLSIPQEARIQFSYRRLPPDLISMLMYNVTLETLQGNLLWNWEELDICVRHITPRAFTNRDYTLTHVSKCTLWLEGRDPSASTPIISGNTGGAEYPEPGIWPLLVVLYMCSLVTLPHTLYW